MFPRDRAVYGKHSTTKEKDTVPGQSDVRSALVTKALQIAPGISSPQLPTCIQFCCSYLIFYEAFICVYRNNKAIFFSLYGVSQELLPDVFCFRILVFFSCVRTDFTFEKDRFVYMEHAFNICRTICNNNVLVCFKCWSFKH